VSRRGEVLCDAAVGEAAPGRALSPQSLLLWMSAVKPVMGVAICQLQERGLLAIEDPVAVHVPEFAAGGKERVRVQDVLTHTGCFPQANPQWGDGPWEQIIAQICAAPLEPGWVPGRDASYHVASGWYALAEIVRRLDGRPYSEYVREQVFLPLGMENCWIGMPEAAHASYGERVSPMYSPAESGSGLEPIGFWPFAGGARGCSICRPGGSGWGPLRELGLLYEALLGGGALTSSGSVRKEPARVLEPGSVAALTSRITRGLLDKSFAEVLDRGLGVVLDSRHHERGGNWFGNRVSQDTFGHGGFGCSVGFADPEHGLVVALGYNGMLEHPVHEVRMRACTDAIYEELGLG